MFSDVGFQQAGEPLRDVAFRTFRRVLGNKLEAGLVVPASVSYQSAVQDWHAHPGSDGLRSLDHVCLLVQEVCGEAAHAVGRILVADEEEGLAPLAVTDYVPYNLVRLDERAGAVPGPDAGDDFVRQSALGPFVDVEEVLVVYVYPVVGPQVGQSGEYLPVAQVSHHDDGVAALGQGMTGIFVVMVVISLIVYALSKLGSHSGKNDGGN